MSQQPGTSKKRKFGKMEALILIPNLLIIGGILFYMAASGVEKDTVQPMIEADPETVARIGRLEAELRDNPGDLSRAIRLARLYTDVGEFPFSYNALKNAELKAGDDPGWRLKLGLAYLELGKNKDGLRVIEETIQRCGVKKCPPNLRIKLDLFARVARLFIERKIDSRKAPIAADKAMKEVFKPVNADPEKMRPKAPDTPEEEKAEPEEEAPAPKKG